MLAPSGRATLPGRIEDASGYARKHGHRSLVPRIIRNTLVIRRNACSEPHFLERLVRGSGAVVELCQWTQMGALECYCPSGLRRVAEVPRVREVQLKTRPMGRVLLGLRIAEHLGVPHLVVIMARRRFRQVLEIRPQQLRVPGVPPRFGDFLRDRPKAVLDEDLGVHDVVNAVHVERNCLPLEHELTLMSLIDRHTPRGDLVERRRCGVELQGQDAGEKASPAFAILGRQPLHEVGVEFEASEM
mmetsp:Transcript_69226/g.192747  ORF Transcript_69226/g.192747 Transcript_69226/m.192747 type:complete len:244 (-) Transcript_69226:4698-5429(-)